VTWFRGGAAAGILVPMPALRCLPDTVEVALRDGTRACIRALVPEDRELIAAAFERLSPRSRFMRFLSPIPRLSKGLLDRLVDVDHEHHVALAAIADGRLIGVARYVVSREDPDQADFAITVIDAHQGRGLGRALTETLASLAAARGLSRFTLDVHPENRVMLRLAASIGARLRFRDGLLSGTVALPLHPTPALSAAA
jgi:RimJ/RimL family protein N-acetyltransferase